MQRATVSTRLSRLQTSLALCVLMAGSWNATGGNLSFLNDTPTRYLTEEDRDLMMQNVNAVLESTDPKASREWVNPKTGNSGGATVQSQFTATDGASCKRLTVANMIKKGSLKNSALYTLCKYEGRGWLLHPDAVPMPASAN